MSRYTIFIFQLFKLLVCDKQKIYKKLSSSFVHKDIVSMTIKSFITYIIKDNISLIKIYDYDFIIGGLYLE